MLAPPPCLEVHLAVTTLGTPEVRVVPSLDGAAKEGSAAEARSAPVVEVVGLGLDVAHGAEDAGGDLGLGRAPVLAHV